MKLARKLALAITVAVFVVMGTYAFVQVQQQVRLFDADLHKDMRLGRALRATAEEVWRMHGEEYARQLIEEADDDLSGVRIRAVWLDLPATDPRRPPIPAEERRLLTAAQSVRFNQKDEKGSLRRYTYLLMSVGDPRPIALELSESLERHHAYIRTSEQQILVTTLIIVAVCGGVVMGLGFWFVGRPIRLLRDRARAVAAGDLGARLTLRQHDEIGDLAEELNAMCDRIVEGRLKLAEETEARIATLEQLRHTDRLTTMGQLASGVAHELGTPLNVISGRAKMMAADDAEGTEIRENARIIAEQSARMAGIIRQLLDFSRRQGPRLGVADLHDVVARTLELLEPFAHKRGVRITVQAAEETLPVLVDQNQIQQALTNVIMNGIQAMRPGGQLTIDVRQRPGRPPGNQGAAEGRYACVVVADDGPGIPREHLLEIFEPFFTTKGVGEGTGLGLSVAYGIVQEHGGWIEVETEVDKGSRFSIFLALSPETLAPLAETGS